MALARVEITQGKGEGADMGLSGRGSAGPRVCRSATAKSCCDVSSAGVLLSAMTHAFTTEGEEVMGLLLGDVTVSKQPARR